MEMVREPHRVAVEPGSASRAPSFAEETVKTGTSTFVSDVTFAWQAVAVRRRLIALMIATALLGGLAYIWVTAPLYTATADILIDPRKRDLVKQEVVQSGLGTSSLGADTFLLDSQIEVIKSDSVLRKLIASEGLDSDPEFAGAPGPLASKLKAIFATILRGPQAARMPEQNAIDRALQTLEKRLAVKREGNTYIVSVTMTSKDPQKAAAIANALTRVYIDDTLDSNRQRVTDAERLLSGRLSELRAAATAAQVDIEDFRAKNGLTGTDRQPLVEQQLRELSQQLTLAATNASRARARWMEVGKVKAAPIELAMAGGTLQSNLLATLQDRYAALAAQEASLSASLMPAHPGLTPTRDAKAAVKREISTELTRLISRTKADYDVAAANEAAIRSSLDAVRGEVEATNRSSIKLKDLERQANAATRIYEEFLTRSNDAREQIALPSDTIRVVSSAIAPSRPSWPAEPLVLGFALVVGVIGALALALMLAVLRPARATA